MQENFLKLSVSKVKTFNQCKKQYDFIYNLKFPRKDRDYHVFGKFCHKVLEDFHLSYINGSSKPLNQEMSLAFKSAVTEFEGQMTPEMKQECWDIINKYLQKASQKQINPINVLAVEKIFEIKLSENVKLSGVIDRVQVDADNTVQVADYKTTKNKKYLVNDYFQLLTYAFALYTEDPSIDKVRGSYILLRHDFEHITQEFSLKEILSIKDQYLKYAEMIEKEHTWEPNPTNLCRFCDFLPLCEAGQKKNPIVKNGEVDW